MKEKSAVSAGRQDVHSLEKSHNILFIVLHYGHAEASPEADVVYVQQEPSGVGGHGQASVWTLLLSQYATTGMNRWRIQVLGS